MATLTICFYLASIECYELNKQKKHTHTKERKKRKRKRKTINPYFRSNPKGCLLLIIHLIDVGAFLNQKLYNLQMTILLQQVICEFFSKKIREKNIPWKPHTKEFRNYCLVDQFWRLSRAEIWQYPTDQPENHHKIKHLWKIFLNFF